ncbi:secreted protein [Candidatus Thiomargarita nelsonii]|uniref:Secreted protein n=1 Tax=Candidatus Thiomargarita nelsonii TaxID=1003181 RepID=A0A176S2T0_9GAMM|nr:secreted protein [Candidatus Thiomargarita nelsonii]
MTIQLKHLPIMLLSIALMSPLWAQEQPSPEEINALSAADENRYDLPNIIYTYTEWGFNLKVNHITLDHVVDYTLNGEIITDIFNALIDQEQIRLAEENDKGFQFEVKFPPEVLPDASEFGLILDNGLKVSSVIYAENRGISWNFSGWYPVINWNNQPENRMLVKGYVNQSEPNCGWWGCSNPVAHQWVQIYTRIGFSWDYKTTVYSDQYGFYSLLIEDHCGSVAAYTARAGKQVWQQQNVWGSCSPSINEQVINLQIR